MVWVKRWMSITGTASLLLSLTAPVDGQTVETPSPTFVFPSATPLPSVTLTPAPPTATASPVPTALSEGFVQGGFAEMVYPAGLYFEAFLDIAASDLEAVRLTVEIEGQPARVISAPIDEWVAQAEPPARLRYLLPFEEESLPPLFSLIAYQWTFTTEAETAELSGTVQVLDPRIRWYVYEDENIRLGSAGTPRVDVFRNLQAAYALLAEQRPSEQPFFTGLVADGALNVGCQPSEDGPFAVSLIAGAVLPCDPALASLLLPPEQVAQPNDARVTLLAQLALAFYEEDWAARSVPIWYIDGFAQWLEAEPHREALLTARAAARTGELFALNASMPQEAVALSRWRAQNIGLILYLVDTLGTEAISLLANAPATENFETTFQRIADYSSSELAAQFARWIFTERATTAFALTPYLAATPTPRPSRTPRPTTIPTQTLTATSAVTNTPTALPTVPSRTPLPTVPTVTPRPPQVLLLLTQTPLTLADSLPPPEPEIPGVEPGRSLLIGSLLVAILILLVTLLRSGRK